MLRKRLIFTLLYSSGSFVLSRNFRLQRVGDIKWLQRNYDFSRVSFFIDELVVLDVTREGRDPTRFQEALKELTRGVFVPIAAGGGIRDIDQARSLLRAGADKIVVNTLLVEDLTIVASLAREFGQQCIVASIDLKRVASGYEVRLDAGTRASNQSLSDTISQAEEWVGELYLNSVDRDGTGTGLDFGILEALGPPPAKPIILAGGVGNQSHLSTGLADARVNAVATANLLNFVGDGLQTARGSLVHAGCGLATWLPREDLELSVINEEGGAEAQRS